MTRRVVLLVLRPAIIGSGVGAAIGLVYDIARGDMVPSPMRYFCTALSLVCAGIAWSIGRLRQGEG